MRAIEVKILSGLNAPLGECIKIELEIKNEMGECFYVYVDQFERLKNATIDQLNNFRLIGDGLGIHWEDLDEDLQVETLYKNYGKNSVKYYVTKNKTSQNLSSSLV